MKFKESNYSPLRQVVRPILFGSLFLVFSIFFALQLPAQGSYGMPPELAIKNDSHNRPITISEIYDNFDALMSNTDTSLNSAKKRAQRWIAHVLPFLNVETDGSLSKKPFSDAIKSIYTSPLQCGDSDLAEWESDGPSNMPDFIFD